MVKSPFHAINPKKVDRDTLLNFSDALDDLKRQIDRCQGDINILKATIIHKQVPPEVLLEERVREKIAQLQAAIKEVNKKSRPYLASLRIASDQKKRWGLF